MAPMTRNQSPNGVPTDAVVAYYESRAKGGVGLIISEGTYIGRPRVLATLEPMVMQAYLLFMVKLHWQGGSA